MMKLKTNKIFTKRPRKKIKNQKNKDQIEKNIYKLGLNNEIKDIFFKKKIKNKKKIKVKILIIKQLDCNF